MIFPVYKPKGITSFDVIRKLKSEYLRGTKIGHGGTLDPLAEGVLVIGIGRESTRALHDVLRNTTKEYVAEIELGKVSETDDSEGPISPYVGSRADLTAIKVSKRKPTYFSLDIDDAAVKPSAEDVHHVLDTFIGDIEQLPPQFSAIKVAGQTAYKRARKGEKVTLQPRTVHLDKIELQSYTYPILKIRVVCGSGVYIRSLARDIGSKLGTGAYLKSLVRTRVGEYTIEQALV